MKTKNIIFTISICLFLTIFLVSGVSAMNINFFYSPQCGSCQKILPLIQNLNEKYSSSYYSWNIFDITKGSYNINAVPFIKIKTNDCREINLIGSQEIPARLKCELQEMTTKDCLTYSAGKVKEGSLFIN